MKISGARTSLLPRREPMRESGRALDCLVELETTEGLTGIALGSAFARQQIQSLAEDLLVGEDPRGVGGLWQVMLEQLERGVTPHAIAVLDLALWDLKARANSEPLWKALGGKRPAAHAYVGGLGPGLSDGEMLERCRTMAQQFGLHSVKLEVGLNQAADLRRLELVRQVFASATAEVQLMIDAVERWSPKEAVRRVREMERGTDLTWVQGPAQRWDFLGLKRVSDGIRSAVCAGEFLHRPGEFLPYFHHHAADVIQLNIERTGITGALQVADAAYGFELPLTLGACAGNVHAHLASALPYCMNVEMIDPLPPHEALASDVRIEHGRAVAGDAPGNGLAIDPERLAQGVARPGH